MLKTILEANEYNNSMYEYVCVLGIMKSQFCKYNVYPYMTQLVFTECAFLIA